MELINRIIKHEDKRNDRVIKNKSLKNNDLISLVRIESVNGTDKETIIKEFNVTELKKEKKELEQLLKYIEKLFKKWGIE